MSTHPDLVAAVSRWYEHERRDFPWREPTATPWGILVSEVMSQQTQMSRVEPRWRELMQKWPTPAALAAASDAEVIRAWDRLGYPRRAVALRRCAEQIVRVYGGEVPADRDALMALPGIGHYTSAAVCSFAFGMRVPVVDTNVRRVLTRAVHGEAVAWRPNAKRDEAEMLALLPDSGSESQPWNAGAMELGAVVCTARSPRCSDCPIRELCQWRGAGYPQLEADEVARRSIRQARFEGSDRQRRGRIMAVLRKHPGGVEVDQLWSRIQIDTDFVMPRSAEQLTAERERYLTNATALMAEGLVAQTDERIHLPGDAPAS